MDQVPRDNGDNEHCPLLCACNNKYNESSNCAIGFYVKTKLLIEFLV